MSNVRLLDPAKLFSIEAEAAVLGAMLIDPPCIGKVLPRLPRAEAFFKVEHQIIYNALVKLFIANDPIDAVALRTELKKQGKLAEVGGAQGQSDEDGGVHYIGRILNSVPSSANVVYYVGVIRAKEKERQVRSAVAEIGEIVDQPGSVDEMIEKIQAIAMDLQPIESGPDYTEMKKLSTQVAIDMRDNQGIAIPTGFADLDRLIHGLNPGELAIMAGRPSMGKSALALGMALDIAKAGMAVFFVSLEMTERSLVERALCSLAAVDMSAIQSGEATEGDWDEIYRQALELEKRDIILSKVGSTPEQLAGLVHRLRQTHDIGIVFIDYIQLMRSSKRTESRQQEITQISAKLKEMALREDIPVVALSQLNRQVDAREDHRPRMSDLRESGSLEQDADLVLFVYRDDYYNKDKPGFEPTGVAEIIVSKNRRGPTGTATLVFVHDYVKFTDLARVADGA
jgi:replicative DNA helicase